MAETVVLLHGFAGTRHGWAPVTDRLARDRYRPLALDLRGHGDARDRRPIGVVECVADVAAAAPARFALCGYSLGGRVALHMALTHPGRVTRLVLVAATAGIEDDAARAERRAADERLAAEIEQGTIEAFAERWMALPLFADTPPAASRRWREDLLRNDPAALAAALRALGPAAMPPLWDRLGELTMPVNVVAGERDERYGARGHRLAEALPDATLTVVPGAGHGLPREAPEAIAEAIAAET